MIEPLCFSQVRRVSVFVELVHIFPYLHTGTVARLAGLHCAVHVLVSWSLHVAVCVLELDHLNMSVAPLTQADVTRIAVAAFALHGLGFSVIFILGITLFMLVSPSTPMWKIVMYMSVTTMLVFLAMWLGIYMGNPEIAYHIADVIIKLVIKITDAFARAFI